MSIPKIIHYCWFGRNPKPKLAEKCIKSWEKYCPDYNIIEWNEDNFDITVCPLYVRQAYEAKQWAFVTDYVRLKLIYEYGGIYMDTDVELIKSLDVLLECTAYFGFENEKFISTGLGFGAKKGTLILKEIMKDYESITFIQADGSFDSIPCPVRNTDVFIRHGLKQDGTYQILNGGIQLLPSEYLCPITYFSGEKNITQNTISIHWFSASWQTKEKREQHAKKIAEIRRAREIDYLIHVPNRILKYMMGDANYEKLKKRLKRGESYDSN